MYSFLADTFDLLEQSQFKNISNILMFKNVTNFSGVSFKQNISLSDAAVPHADTHKMSSFIESLFKF